MRRILVTGGCGFVGRHLVARLARDGDCTIWIVDDLSSGRAPRDWPQPAIADWRQRQVGYETFSVAAAGTPVYFIHGNLLGLMLAELGHIPDGGRGRMDSFDEIYHLASVVGGRATIEGDPLAVGIDLAIDSTFFLWAAKVNRPKRILYASSSAAYPTHLQANGNAVALREDMIDFGPVLGTPDLTYGWSKLTGEYLGRIAASTYGLSVATVRPFSGYGEHQEPIYPFPAIALRVAARLDPVVVWGDGRQARDFVHIEDAVEACVRACRAISDGSGVNIGNGAPVSMLDLARRMAEIDNLKAEIRGTSGRPVGVAQRFCDPSLMTKILGFTPRISLDDGIRRALEVARARLAAGMRPPA